MWNRKKKKSKFEVELKGFFNYKLVKIIILIIITSFFEFEFFKRTPHQHTNENGLTV